MMYVLSGGAPVLHPCVEINLRRTMGRVAVDLWQRLEGKTKTEMNVLIDTYLPFKQR